jgi:hypothetical protein
MDSIDVDDAKCRDSPLVQAASRQTHSHCSGAKQIGLNWQFLGAERGTRLELATACLEGRYSTN